jgi:uncharacterized protein YbbK (DUF523 family)
MRIVSACLVGVNCRWNGTNRSQPELIKELKKGKVLPLCPERLGGLPTPRPAAGILEGVGEDVWAGRAIVLGKDGQDFTKQFIKGAKEFLRITKELGVEEVVLKKTSPSCGVGKVWRMSRKGEKLSNRLVDGDGVLTALLKKNGIKVISERDI